MTTSVAVEQLYCARCSDPVESVDEDGYGRCCHNLPNPWHRGSDGLYTCTSFNEDAEEEDENEDDLRPRCPHCNGTTFRFAATEWRRHALSLCLDGLDNELDDSTLSYDRDDFDTGATLEYQDFSIEGIVCTACRQDISAYLNVEES